MWHTAILRAAEGCPASVNKDSGMVEQGWLPAQLQAEVYRRTNIVGADRTFLHTEGCTLRLRTAVAILAPGGVDSFGFLASTL